MHIALLGDSVFDNQAYVGSDPDVRAQLQQALTDHHKVTLLAIDGSVVEGVFAQLKRLPKDTTHIFASVGGSNILAQIHLLQESTPTMGAGLVKLSEVVNIFRQTYHAMLSAVLERELPTTICALFNPRFPDPDLQRASKTALTAYNDAIIQEAFLAGVPLIDLRQVCTEDGDYANPIEASSQGGAKITQVMLDVLEYHDFSHRQTRVYF